MIYGFLKLTHLNNDHPMFLQLGSITRIVVREDKVTAVYTIDKNDDNRARYHLVKETPEQIGKSVEDLMVYQGNIDDQVYGKGSLML